MPTILLVEDNQVYRETLKEALEYEGYDVMEAADGAAALSLLRQSKPDAILSNMEMPDINGIEFLRSIKADPHWKTIPFALITGSNDDDIAQVARDLGANAVLHKPILLNELYELLNSLLHE